MNKLPNPPPDRRIQKMVSDDNIRLSINNASHNGPTISPSPSHNNLHLSTSKEINSTQKLTNKKSQSLLVSNISLNNIQGSSNYIFSEPNDKESLDRINNLSLVKLKHIEDMRNNILNYKLLSDKKMFLSSNTSDININKCNIILFGPSGSGKSSFIKTLYRALYGTKHLPPEAMSKLIIKETDQNEGTLYFTRLHLKEESNQTSGLVICDTRGHIMMNKKELEQFKVLIDGKVKDNLAIEQSKKRSPLLLWEFWKKDTELFPKEIFNAKEPGLDSLPHNVVLVFDGSIDDIIDQDDEAFYRDLVKISINKGN